MRACVVVDLPDTLAARQSVELDVVVCNPGPQPWPSDGPEPVTLGYRWLDPRGFVHEGPHVRLPCDVEPGRLVRVKLPVQAPDRAGGYRLVVTPVLGDRFWFDEQDEASSGVVDVTVIPSDILAADDARSEIRTALPREVQTGQVLELAVRVTNQGRASWAALGEHAVGIGHRWTARGGGVVEGARLPLHEDLAPGATAELIVDVATPDVAGRYELEVGMAQERVRWFSELDRANASFATVDVVEPGLPPTDDPIGYGEWLLRRFPPPATRMTRSYGRRLYAFVEHALQSPMAQAAMKGGHALPAGFGAGLDERAIEFAWVLAQIRGGRVLDAGSTLNHATVLDAVLPRVQDLHILTLAPEEEAAWDRGVSYVYGDLRALPYRDGWFDVVACISTLEHVGMDNRAYGDESGRAEDPLSEQARAVAELARVVRPGGRLLVTVPFGAELDHGWMMTFSRARLAEVLAGVRARSREVAIFAYSDTGWRRSGDDAVAQARSYDPRLPESALGDAAKGARAVACARLDL
jgi:SAM-dependent methyltransferase